MSAGDFMGLALVVTMILVIINVLAGAYKRRLAFKERALELTASNTAQKAAPYAAQVERLEQRMRVLERIATDKGTDLAAQIEDLREAVAVRGELQ